VFSSLVGGGRLPVAFAVQSGLAFVTSKHLCLRGAIEHSSHAWRTSICLSNADFQGNPKPALQRILPPVCLFTPDGLSETSVLPVDPGARLKKIVFTGPAAGVCRSLGGRIFELPGSRFWKQLSTCSSKHRLAGFHFSH
jgi:hypothetical protein